MDKIKNIREKLKDFENFQPLLKDLPQFSMFKPLLESDIKQIIKKMQNKPCELDILPTNVLKCFLNELLPTITQLVNQSLTQCVFPAKWKQAVVRP